MRTTRRRYASIETKLIRDALSLAEVHRIPMWRQNTGAIPLFYNGRRRLFRAGSKGASDLLGLLPPTGRLIAAEAKRPGNKPTDDQVAYLNAVNFHGGAGFWFDSLDDFERALCHADRGGRFELDPQTRELLIVVEAR